MRPIPFIIACIVFAAPAPAADETIPWPEHPRPDFMREPWLNLNGRWKFAFDPNDVGITEGWYKPGEHNFDREIVVPFAWESKLSGIGENFVGVGWYAREITLPDGDGWKGKDVWLIVGACDFIAKVWINGRPAGEFTGGYLPFEVNLSWFVKSGEKANIVIRAEDKTDLQQPLGKQHGWYTRTSGIWQTVYLEPRGGLAQGIRPGGPDAGTFIERLSGAPDIKMAAMKYTVKVRTRQPCWLTLSSPGGEFAEARVSVQPDHPEVTIQAKLKELTVWSPDSPKLYPARFELAVHPQDVRDVVETYFGLREVSIAKAPGREYQYIHLNGQPIYLRGALHQSFHPDGVYQYPDDATMRGDYELCRKIGINMLRIHIKTPIPRELYWADRLGVLIMQDIPNFWHHSDQARAWYEKLLEGAIARDFNHPAIFAWVNFNETWGLDSPGPYDADRQKWVVQMYEKTKKLDPTRLVEDNSPCKYDHTVTDINSWHFYINDYEQAKKHIAEVVEKTHPGSTFNYAKGYAQRNEPLMNSEYGGISAGLGDQDISWCFKYLTNELRKHDRVCGYIYTELSDIEWEHNGFVNYDRSEKKYAYGYWHPGITLKDFNRPDFIVIDAPPMIELKPGETRDVPIRISHWSSHKAENLKIRWRTRWPGIEALPEAIATFGGVQPEPPWQTRTATWKPFEVVEQPPLPITAHESEGRIGALCVELFDGAYSLARNYVNLTTGSLPPAVRVIGREALLLSFSPGDYSDRTFAAAAPAGGREASWVAGQGSGYYQYDLQIPENVAIERADRLLVLAEMASRSGDAKLDWPARRTPHDRPQTDGKEWPGDLRISVNGVEISRLMLPDDPADARGALSHHRGLQGGYGYLSMEPAAEGEVLRRILGQAGADRLLRVRFEVPAGSEYKGGFTLYGQGVGQYGVPPTLALLFTGEGHGLAAGFGQSHTPAVNRAVERIHTPVATAEAGGHEWRYTVDAPPAEWVTAEFDETAAGWKQGRGGFGSRGTPNAIIGTRWNRPDIWLRTRFTLEDPATLTGGAWRLYHDEDVEIHVNGRKVLERTGFETDYIDVPLDSDMLKALRAGVNVLAVHCRQTDGGQNIDVGLTLTRGSR